MKITKTSVSVFLVTFLIGYVFVPTAKKEVSISFETATKLLKTLPQPIKIKSEIEILEENNDWKNVDESKFKIKLLETGEGFHGDQIEAKSGETWLGLFKENDKYFLRSTKIKVRRVHDEIVDDDGGKTGKSVIVKGKNQPIYLLRNAKELSEGEVPTFFGGNPNGDEIEEDKDYISLRSGLVKEYKIGGQKFSLKVKTGENKNGEKISALVLESGNIKQVLHSVVFVGENDYLGTLYWVGDLDRDGKPDFYFDLYFHDNVEYKNLFLSSEAKKGKLLKKVATFIITGC